MAAYYGSEDTQDQDQDMPGPLCNCGTPSIIKTVSKGRPENMGKRFWTCLIPKDSGGCGFFKWEDQAFSSNEPPQKKRRFSSRPSPTRMPLPAFGRGLTNGHSGNLVPAEPTFQKPAVPALYGPSGTGTSTMEDRVDRPLQRTVSDPQAVPRMVAAGLELEHYEALMGAIKLLGQSNEKIVWDIKAMRDEVAKLDKPGNPYESVALGPPKNATYSSSAPSSGV